MSQEKRRFSRVFFEANATLTVGDQEFAVGKIANVSIGGCLLEVEADLEIGQECLLTIPLSHMGPGVDIYGEIVRKGIGGISLQFNRITPESLNHLQNIIRYNAENPEQIEEEISSRPGLK